MAVGRAVEGAAADSWEGLAEAMEEAMEEDAARRGGVECDDLHQVEAAIQGTRELVAVAEEAVGITVVTNGGCTCKRIHKFSCIPLGLCPCCSTSCCSQI